MQPVYRWLIPALWLAWIAYWFIAARGAKATARREPWTSRLSHILPLALGIWFQSVPTPGWPSLERHVVTWTPALFWVGTALVVAGLGWTVYARRHLGANWSGVVEQKQGHELIRTGPYGWTRHPIYTGLLLAFTGAAVTLDRWRGLLGLLIIAAAFIRKLRTEEQFMQELFPLEYPRYRRAVGALLPWPGSTQRQRKKRGSSSG